MHRRVTVVALMLVVVGATVLAAACNTGTETGELTPATSTVAVAPTTGPRVATPASEADSEEAAVLAAVEGYWRTILAANDPPDPDHPDLEKYMTGPALETSRANVEERRSLGQAIRLPERPAFRTSTSTVKVDGHSAFVKDCVVDDSVLYDVPSDLVLNSRVRTFLFSMLLRGDGETWRVSELQKIGEVDGVEPCDEF
jgi:hypothetical protein